MSYVLDASAVLAILNQEPGAAKAIARLPQALISAVNAVEVGSKLVDGGMPAEMAAEAVDLLGIPVIAFDAAQGRSAVALRSATRARGLSLADRACLALAIRENATAVTADRAWAKIGEPCPVELIR